MAIQRPQSQDETKIQQQRGQTAQAVMAVIIMFQQRMDIPK